MTSDYSALLRAVEKIARDAGAAILAIYSRDFAVQAKDDRSPLTEADSAAHAIIEAGLAHLNPRLPILSEEGTGFSGADRSGRYWLVDPLDGTKEFIKRNGEFTVNIALIQNGRPVLGVVYAPVPNIAYLSAVDIGAFKITNNGPRTRIHVATRHAGAPWRVVGSRSHAGDSLKALLRSLGPHELISMGSSLKFCLVAEGHADLYPRLGPTSLWDTAAAQCVVEQAGGSVVKLDGTPLGYADPTCILNPFFVVRGGALTNWPEFKSFGAEYSEGQSAGELA